MDDRHCDERRNGPCAGHQKRESLEMRGMRAQEQPVAHERGGVGVRDDGISERSRRHAQHHEHQRGGHYSSCDRHHARVEDRTDERSVREQDCPRCAQRHDQQKARAQGGERSRKMPRDQEFRSRNHIRRGSRCELSDANQDHANSSTAPANTPLNSNGTARLLGISRNTIRRYVRAGGPPGRQDAASSTQGPIRWTRSAATRIAQRLELTGPGIKAAKTISGTTANSIPRRPSSCAQEVPSGACTPARVSIPRSMSSSAVTTRISTAIGNALRSSRKLYGAPASAASPRTWFDTCAASIRCSVSSRSPLSLPCSPTADSLNGVRPVCQRTSGRLVLDPASR